MFTSVQEKASGCETKDVNENILDDSDTCNDIKSTIDAVELPEPNTIDELVIKIDDSIKSADCINAVKINEEILETPSSDNNQVEIIDENCEKTTEELLILDERYESDIISDDETAVKEKEELLYEEIETEETLEGNLRTSSTMEVNKCLVESITSSNVVSGNMNSLHANALNDGKIKQDEDGKVLSSNSINEVIISDVSSNAEMSEKIICIGECDKKPLQISIKSAEISDSTSFLDNLALFSSEVKKVDEFSESLEEERGEETRTDYSVNEESSKTSIFGKKNELVFQENAKAMKESINHTAEKSSVDEPVMKNLKDLGEEDTVSEKENISEIFAHKSASALKETWPAVNLDKCTENNSELIIHNFETRSISTNEDNNEQLREFVIKATTSDATKQINEESPFIEEITRMGPITCVNEESITRNEVLESNNPTRVDDIEIKELTSRGINLHNSINSPTQLGETFAKNSTTLLEDDNFIQIYSCEYNFSDRIICECFVGNSEETSSHSLASGKISETGELYQGKVINQPIEITEKEENSLLLQPNQVSSKIDGIANNLKFNLESDEDIPIKEISSDILAEKLFELIKEHLNSSKIKIFNVGGNIRQKYHNI